MPKVVKSHADAVQVLDRFLYCLERAESASLRASWHPGTETADRERGTANNWQTKADDAEVALRAYLSGPQKP
jgi:hypothetical protein